MRPISADGQLRNRQQITGAIEYQHRQHGAGEFDMQRAFDARHSAAAAIGIQTQGVERGARKCKHQTEQHRRQTELLKAEQR